jgi:two-component system, response regulator
MWREKSGNTGRCPSMKPLPPKILIVEDNADDEALLMRQLEKADLHTRVKVIQDGGQALAYLVNEEHACENLVAIFLDMQLPTLTGLQLLRSIRSLERISHLPVFLMTSSNDPKEIEHCRVLGISAFVPKPVTFATFTNAVASTFHTRR